ncbi:unnamed protein product, partial [Toxocara canis]
VTNVNFVDKVVTCVEKTEDGDKTIHFDYDILINTSPLDLLIKHTKLCPELRVQRSKVFIVGVGLKKPLTDFLENLTWLYIPDLDVPFYRVTILSNFGDFTPDSSKYWSLLCECGRKVDDPVTEEEIRNAAIEGLLRKKMFKRDQIVSVYSTLLPYGYPIPTIRRDIEVARAHKVLEKHSIYSRGRFGGWKYEASNQDHCFIQGKELVDRILFDEPEQLYKTGLAAKEG